MFFFQIDTYASHLHTHAYGCMHANNSWHAEAGGYPTENAAHRNGIPLNSLIVGILMDPEIEWDKKRIFLDLPSGNLTLC